MTASEDEPRLQSKVERVISRYGLSGLGETLERYWTRQDDRYSLRSLADYLNQELLQSAMEEAGMRPLNGEIENTYRLLTDSEVSSGSRRQAERALEREGVDVETLERDFVSHQAVYTYLREHRGISHEREESTRDRREKARETIERLQSRTEAVTTNVLHGLDEDGRLPFDEFDVVVNVRVFDPATGDAHDIDDILREEAADP